MNIVGKQFTPAAFAEYVTSLELKTEAWQGKFIVLHNTGAPTLAERPDGLTAEHIQNLKVYYEGLGWHAGPHLFVDDHGIWVFSPLTAPGVHSPSWNQVSYGVEQLGDFDVEQYNFSRGALVKANAIAAVAILSRAVGIDSHSMKLHKSDPLTEHKNCPGQNCASMVLPFMEDVHDYNQRLS